MNQQEKIKILAEKVMGWVKAGDAVNSGSYEDEKGNFMGYWNPYEDIEDAWDLVGKIQPQTTHFHLIKDGDEPKWEAGFQLYAKNCLKTTAQEAICEAALKWVESYE